jgi:hypothetical protein
MDYLADQNDGEKEVMFSSNESADLVYRAR